MILSLIESRRTPSFVLCNEHRRALILSGINDDLLSTEASVLSQQMSLCSVL